MKPRFIEVIKLGVLVGVIALALSVVVHGPSDCREAVSALASDGVQGWFSTAAMLIKWMIYGFICVTFACAACLLLNALGVLTTIIEKIGGGMMGMVRSIRNAWSPPPVPVDTAIGRRRDGTPVTLGEMLSSLSGKIKALEAKTEGLEPPPPPEAPEDTIAKLQAELEKLRSDQAVPASEVTK